MDHVALNRTGPDDRHLHDEVVECPWLRGNIAIWARLSI
jgi:hypothetical protein